MELKKAEIKNYRLLRDVEITFDSKTTSIVGKNNSGKTSLSSIFRVFFGSESTKKIKFEDFSLDCHDDFVAVYDLFKEIDSENKKQKISAIQRDIPKIQLKLTLKYNMDGENLTNLVPFFSDLDERNEVPILCEYAPNNSEKFLISLTQALKGHSSTKEELIKAISQIYHFHYDFKIRPFSETEVTDDVSFRELQKLIKVKFIQAQRAVDDSGVESRSKLSRVFETLFKIESKRREKDTLDLVSTVSEASEKIDKNLGDFFGSYISHFRTFGFPEMRDEGDERIILKSQLEPAILLEKNIKLFYEHRGSSLPEKYNGLGYSNLIFIIAQIAGFYEEVREEHNTLKLIFIEEPEAHMHAQMQSVFIKNIGKFLDQVGLRSQTILTTHSSHILIGSEIDSIRYFSRPYSSYSTTVKDLIKFHNSENNEAIEFIKQYMTLGKCDLFFANKAILFEGTVERILLPRFIKKIDEEEKLGINLSEQYIAAIEIGGAYMHKFRELLEFLELRTLIITDIDAVDCKTNEKNPVEVGIGMITSNATLKDWIPGKTEIDTLLKLTSKQKQIKGGGIRVTYQTIGNHTKDGKTGEEIVKCGRSFEEAFIIDNSQYIFDNKSTMKSIKFVLKDMNSKEQIWDESYKIHDFIDRNKKKTDFAFDLLNIDAGSWNVPEYIKEGLVWLAQQ